MKALTMAVLGLALSSANAGAENPQFPPEQVQKGAQLFAMNCATCHGTRMRNPQWAIDLRTFPRDAKTRFVDSVMNGKRNMPPWDDVLKPDDLDALWAYVSTGDPGDRRQDLFKDVPRTSKMQDYFADQSKEAK